MLSGREEVCASLDSLLAAVRQGRSEALVLVGPAGIGKTTLLDYAAAAATDMRMLRAKGVPDEAGIPYAGLSQVLTPLLDLIPLLPRPQAAAVSAALAVGPSVGTDVFPVYAGTLGLLSAAASRGPLVVLVDDGHWLDPESMQAFMFAQRRLSQDPILFLLTFRTEADVAEPPTGLPRVELNGLDVIAAASLLEQNGHIVTDELLHWLVDATGGNPLALRDLPALASPEEIAEYAMRSRPAPIGPTLAAAYGRAVGAMEHRAQQAVLIAALLDDADVRVVNSALKSADLTTHDLEPAEDASLLVVAEGALRMRHPLVRSAVLQFATPSSRRAARLAAARGLAESTRPRDREARIWHLAEAAVAADEHVAAMLEELARSATARSGAAAACMTYEKAAELSESGDDRLRRLLAAAEAAFTAGNPTKCADLLSVMAGEEAEPGTSPHVVRVEHLLGRLETWTGDPPRAALRLLAQAELTRDTDPALSLELSVDATVAAMLAGQMQTASQTARLVASIGRDLGGDVALLGDLLVGAVQAARGDGNAARSLLDPVRGVLGIPDPAPELLQHVVYLATAYNFIDGFDDARPLFTRAVAAARKCGAVGLLPFALTQLAVTDFRTGAWDAAYAGASEALRLAEDSGRTTDRPNTLAVLAMIEAARGHEDARGHALTAISEASAMGAGFIEAQAHSMLGLYELTIGRPAAAVEPLNRCGEMALRLGILELGHLQWAAELVESLLRCEALEQTARPLETMRESLQPATTALNRALLARCEGLVATDGLWERHFEDALALHAEGKTRPFELARTQLCFGERLRRQRRRKDARTQLTAAWETFSQLGAATWAQRAAREIKATGVSMPGVMKHRTDVLTPQEMQVALVVSGGATNREAAEALFLSQKTVEFHLSSIYRRLEMHSRTELSELVQAGN